MEENKEEENKDLIHLQAAHVTQYEGKDGKSVWHVRKNVTSEDLYELPGDMTEKHVFAALHFARAFELEAWNAGIQFMKGELAYHIQAERDRAMKHIQTLEGMNERLSEKLAKFIGEEEEI